MSQKGWISIHRKILNNPVFQDPYLFKLWMFCLLKASHKEHKQLVGKEVIILEDGQFIWGRNEAANELNHGTRPKEQKSPSTWERYLKLLEELGMLNRSTNNKYTIVSVINWRVYQKYSDENEQHNEQQVNSERTASEQQVNTNNNVNNANNVNKSSSSTRDPEFAKVMDFYQANLQKGNTESPFNQELLIKLFNEFGPDVLLAAMKVAAKAEKRGINFLEGVLKNWREAGVKTIEDARRYETEFRESRKYSGGFNVVNIKGGNDYDPRDYAESVGDHGIKLYK